MGRPASVWQAAPRQAVMPTSGLRLNQGPWQLTVPPIASASSRARASARATLALRCAWGPGSPAQRVRTETSSSDASSTLTVATRSAHASRSTASSLTPSCASWSALASTSRYPGMGSPRRRKVAPRRAPAAATARTVRSSVSMAAGSSWPAVTTGTGRPSRTRTLPYISAPMEVECTVASSWCRSSGKRLIDGAFQMTTGASLPASARRA